MDVSSVFVTQKGSKSQGSTQHELEAGRPLRIGRSDDNDIIWNEPWVSHYHCEILLQDFGMCTLKVISNNGVSLVRSSQVLVVKAHKTSELIEGDYVILKGPHHARRDLQLHISFGGSTETKSSVVMKLLHVMDRIRGLERENTQLECKLQRGSVQASTTTISMSDASVIEALQKRKASLEDRIIKQKIHWELEVHALNQTWQENELMEQNKQVRATYDHMKYMTRSAEEVLDPLKKLPDWNHTAREREKPLAYDEILDHEERLRLQDEANQLRLEDEPAEKSRTALNPASKGAAMEEVAEASNTVLNPPSEAPAMEEVTEASNTALNLPSEVAAMTEVTEAPNTVLNLPSEVAQVTEESGGAKVSKEAAETINVVEPDGEARTTPNAEARSPREDDDTAGAASPGKRPRETEGSPSCEPDGKRPRDA
eukprot:GEMP01045256.1.p1 GENE.GEMP01045256.1~~GEMP01045256.1.p1  ORF type:complete len:428 (-),score=89.22 GEMP01045256.1:449-1732(-)